MANPETLIQNQIQVAVSKSDCTIFRTNVGTVKLSDGRWFKTGLPAGHADLYGFRHWDGRVFYIEVKTKTGRPRQDQINFHRMLVKHNIIHGIARSAEDAVLIVKKGYVGYGFKD